MNFAAQFFANFVNDGLQPQETRRGFNDSEEYDPFWQRWETVACKSETLRVSPTPNTSQCPLESERCDSSETDMDESRYHVATPSHPAVPPSSDSHSPAPARKTPKQRRQPEPSAATVHVLDPGESQAGVSKRVDDPQPASKAPGPSLVDPAELPSSVALPPFPQLTESAPFLSLFQALVYILLRLFLSFILLFLPRTEQRRGSSKPDCSFHSGPCAKDAHVVNGRVGRRSTLICPERLKDFGAEEYLNGDVKVFETTVSEPPEVQLMSTPKPSVKKGGEGKSAPKAAPEHLRFEDISAAAFKLQQSGIQKTPCTYSRLSKQYGMEIYLKKELLHYTGSVKERGVLCLLSSLKQDQQRKGVIVATDCNFSMAVAYHAVEMRIPVFVIMPAYSSPPRLRMYRDYGAMVISYGSTARDSINHARHLAKENGYLCLEEDDSAVYLAGLGTVGLEIYEQVPKLDAVIVPAGGHCGLLAGTAAAIKHLNPRISVIGVEPEEFPLLLQSLKTDSLIKDLYCNPNKKLYRDLVDHSLGTHTFQLAKKLVDKVISVREADALVAMLRFQEYERSTVDTEGAMGLAAILGGQLPELKGKSLVVVVSSANMELDLVLQCVERALVLDDRVGRFTVQLADWPGDMAKLLDLLAREDVRLLDVCHRRYSDKAELFKAQVECVVEMRDKSQNSQLRRTLSDRYPSLRWLER
ncbi:L-threonine ammonia-lyase [Ctenopharyngodon idella]|uniref:L-threonine ammonia-lyase n=1 Tax=Ctenopharyngodon idella TaxID=7959 RepID=UPI00222EA3D9|nr:L-threonine ammonia-lyase [Ctenopharyngodon idella]